jgi:hypothetical protein
MPTADAAWSPSSSIERPRTECDACVTIDVPFFRRSSAARIQAMQWTEVQEADEGPGTEGCEPAPRVDTVHATVAVPPR